MVADPVILEAHNGALFISETAPEWCRVSVQLNGDTYFLGSETPEVIALRIRQALERQPRGKRDSASTDDSLHWVMTLNELHGSLYARYHNEGLDLLIENADGVTEGKLELSLREIENWKTLLSECS